MMTTMNEPGDGLSGEVSQAAEEVRSRREPKHDEATRAGWRERKRRQAASQKTIPRHRRTRAQAEERPSQPEPEPYVATEAGIIMSAVLGNTLWNLSRIFTKHRELTPEESRQLGEALDPVLHKYLPVLEDWKEETALAMVLFTLWQTTGPPPTDSHAEVLDLGTNDAKVPPKEGT